MNERDGVALKPPPPRRWVGTTVLEAFEQVARRSPDAIAASCAGASISYGELDSRARCLASYLIASAIMPDTFVAVCVPRSIEMIVSLLGIWKAGAAYLPLDPSYPPQRIEYMLSDSGVGVVVTEAAFARLFSNSAAVTVCIDTHWSDITAAGPITRAVRVFDQNLAYVIYTSGSSGKPKGVMISHAALRNQLLWRQKDLALDRNDRVLQRAALSYDPSVYEIFWPLTTGARLVIPHHRSAKDPHYLVSLIRDEDITVIGVGPSLLWAMLLEGLEDCRCLRRVSCGGEALNMDVVRSFLSKCAGSLYNIYGPTETCVCSMFWDAKDTVEATIAPIGQAIDNTVAEVLDDQFLPVPTEAEGELYISGTGLARGYLNRPALTAARFLPSGDGRRMYRTGDLASWSSTGDAIFRGRNDQQVKLAGHRIELEEIESVLMRQPFLKAAAVAIKTTGNVPRLFAYVVPNEFSADLEGAQLTQWREVNEQIHLPFGTEPVLTAMTVGWNSSYDGKPLPAHEMEEWVNQTVSRILMLEPKSVVEIGSGTGLIATQVAPRCETYIGVDSSKESQLQLKRQVEGHLGLNNLSLIEADAGRLPDLPPFDTFIINSVVQYFPNGRYLERVLDWALKRIGRGHIFVGDVRDLRLLRAFLLSLEVHGGRAGTRLDVDRKVTTQAASEEELLIHPAFFHRLQNTRPAITGVKVLLKRGVSQNELTKFRYDVIIEVNGINHAVSPRNAPGNLGSEISPRDLAAILSSADRTRSFALFNVPNRRLSCESHALAWLNGDGPETFPNGLLDALPNENSMDPEELYDLGERLGFNVDISPALSPTNFDVAFFRDRAFFEPNRNWPLEESEPLFNNPALVLARQILPPRLRVAAKASLPEHMVPSSFLVVETIPKSPSGKVDRRALPEPSVVRPRLPMAYVPPRDRQEQMIATLWQDYLQVEYIGIDDDFYMLGGTSLLAIQILFALQQSSVRISLAAFIGHPTIRGLAKLIGAAEASPNGELTSLSSDSKADLCVSFEQERMLFLAELDPQSTAYSIPSTVRIRGPLVVDILASTLNRLRERHEVFRTTFELNAEEAVPIITPPGHFDLATMDLTETPPEEQEALVRRLVAEEASRPFQLSEPLFRAVLFYLSSEDHILFINIHHVIFDGWSATIFRRELGEMYSAALQGTQPTLEELSIRYVDYARWQRSTEPHIDREIAYWRVKLAEPLPRLQLSPDPMLLDSSRLMAGAYSVRALSRKQLRAIRRFARESATTPYVIMLSAFKVFLHRYTGATDLIVGSATAGRPMEEVKSLIGLFVNTVVLRTNISPTSSFCDVVREVRTTVDEAHVHEVPFEQLVKNLQPERHAGRNPFFNTMFVHETEPFRRVAAGEATFEFVDADNGAAKFDLTLVFIERELASDIRLAYRSAFFSAADINRMLGTFLVLLENAILEPGVPVTELAATSDTTLPSFAGWEDNPRPQDSVERTHVSSDIMASLNPGRSMSSPDAGGSCRLEQTRRKLLALWTILLGHGDIGMQDSFFRVGGHSLLAMKLMSRIRREFGVKLGVRCLFDHPTLAELAEIIETNRSSSELPAE